MQPHVAASDEASKEISTLKSSLAQAMHQVQDLTEQLRLAKRKQNAITQDLQLAEQFRLESEAQLKNLHDQLQEKEVPQAITRQQWTALEEKCKQIQADLVSALNAKTVAEVCVHSFIIYIYIYMYASSV
jgi:chromosome segregation ATPase